MDQKPERFLLVNTVAKRLNVSPKCVYSMIRDGSLKAIRVGKRSLRITETSYNQFIESREVDPKEYFA